MIASSNSICPTAGQARLTSSRPAPARAGVVAKAGEGSTEGLNKYSARITQPRSQGASQAMLYATGLKEEDLNKPQVNPKTAMMRGSPRFSLQSPARFSFFSPRPNPFLR